MKARSCQKSKNWQKIEVGSAWRRVQGPCASGLTPEVAHFSLTKLSARAPGTTPVEMGTIGVVACRDRGVSSGRMGPPQGGVGLPQETPGCPKRLSGLGVSRGSSRGAKGDGWRSMVCRNPYCHGLARWQRGYIYAIGQSPGAAAGVHPMSVAKPPIYITRTLGRGSQHPLR